jgi:hypothetical protein
MLGAFQIGRRRVGRSFGAEIAVTTSGLVASAGAPSAIRRP